MTSIGLPIEASAQQAGTIHVAFNYKYFLDSGGATDSWTFTGSADLTPVDGGYDGVGTGQYNEYDVYPAAEPCSSPHVTTASGKAELTVQARYSIDNPDTGGPDTSMYNSSTSVIEVIYLGNGVPWQESPSVDGDKCIPSAQGTYDVYGDCHFYGIDFSKGGTYHKADEDAPDSSTCSITITPVAEDLKIFGTAKGLFGQKGIQGISNSKVLVFQMEEDKYYKKLSQSKPDFRKTTATTDDKDAKYEVTWAREPGKLPKLMVVSLLWYEGKPEFAITNGKEAAGRFIPVYQALCVDDIDGSNCVKWQRTANGTFEAEVNFEYGSEDKLVQMWQILESEDWEAMGVQASAGGGIVGLPALATSKMMADSAYMYYNGYRAMKYIETLGLQSQLNPLLIRSHDFDPDCQNEGKAWYNGKFVSMRSPKAFGDLGTFADKVTVNDEVVMCDADNRSALEYYLAPDLPYWHEIGHYLQFQMYDANGDPRGTPHEGYKNDGTNDSLVEGFAGFVAMLIHEYYGLQDPHIYNSVDVELDVKIWGDDQSEEEAVAGILWDFHDGGREINLGYFRNASVTGGSYSGGTPTPVSKVYTQSIDEVSLSGQVILKVIERNRVKNLVELYNAFVSEHRIGSIDMDMIYVNHGVFADVEDRNFVHDSMAEKIGESGSLISPDRLVRLTPPPNLPGSYLVSDVDATYNFTFKLDSPYSDHNYSYLREMKAGEPMPFRMPPEYYPSTAKVTQLSADGEQLRAVSEIGSDQYWQYINSSPPKDGVFKQISASSESAAQYIQNAKDLLSRTSTEYKAGNYTGAEELVSRAYLDNFEHVESDLEQRNATELQEQTEQLMRVELIGLIRDKASPQAVDGKIAEIIAKLDEAIVVVPEFPLASLGIMFAAIGAVAMVGRLSSSKTSK